MIPFNSPVVIGNLKENFDKLIMKNKFCGDGEFTKKCKDWFDNYLDRNTLLTTSCTHALEMAALLIDIQKGDEVIMPSYTFVSTANAFVLRGAKIVFVDVKPSTMNIDENKIEKAITSKTKAICVVHYGGVACEMDTIMQIADKYKLFVVEDAAQAMMGTYKGKHLGTIGDFGTYSFHETKNYHCGEGGLLIINNQKYVEKAEIIREKGTNRSRFLRGQVDKYTWVNIGSSYLPSELNAMYLYSQLDFVNEVNNERLKIWNLYYKKLYQLENNGKIELAKITKHCKHNAHLFYLKVKDGKERDKLIEFLKARNIQAVFHYIPLHSSPFGLTHSVFKGKDIFTTIDSNRLLRLPLYYGLTIADIDYVVDSIKEFFNEV